MFGELFYFENFGLKENYFIFVKLLLAFDLFILLFFEKKLNRYSFELT